jgi:hypothetical protein
VIDDSYTASDHEFREDDAYAETKYRLTLRWLGPGNGRLLFNIGCGHGRFTRWRRRWLLGEHCEPTAASAVDNQRTRVRRLQLWCFELPRDLHTDVVVMHDVLELDAPSPERSPSADLLPSAAVS